MEYISPQTYAEPQKLFGREIVFSKRFGVRNLLVVQRQLMFIFVGFVKDRGSAIVS